MSTTAQGTGVKPIVLAYSGGLDTSFLVPWIAEQHRRPVITVTVDTGGIDAATAGALAERARALGAVEHHQVDARADYFEQVLRFLIMGNVRRGQLYPLCVGAERVMQAQTMARMARELGSPTVAHGCTAAGNDQVRFEVALRTLAPELAVLAPVRDQAFRRADELEYLATRALPVPPSGAAYSVNRGLWGVTIGGKETLSSAGSIPDHAWILTRDAFSRPRPAQRHVLAFREGRPVALDGRPDSPVAIIESLEALAAPFGIGRGIHLGDTIIGTKGRVAFEAPAAEVLLTAHRELEKLVLTGRQQRIKELAGFALRGPGARRSAARPGVPRHRGAAALVAGARHGRGPSAPADRQSLHRGGGVALLAHGGLARGVRRGCRGVVGDRCARLLAHRLAPRCVPHARRASRPAPPGRAEVVIMRSVVVDKLASVTQACGLSHEVRVSADIPAEEGVVVVVEVLTNKSTYNTLELVSGRMAKVGKGDIVAGALGHRKALFGYSGHVPERVQPGDVIQMLNIGGVLGMCDSINPDKGKPFDCRVLGVALNFPYLGERIGVPARVGYKALDVNATARHPRRAGGGARRHLHGGRQDRRRLRDRSRACATAGYGRCLQGDRRITAARHPRDGGRGRAALR